MTRPPKLSRASVLSLATNAAATRAKRGAASSVRLGASFEDVVEAMWKSSGWCQRGHPETKMVPTHSGPRLVHVGRNGVDFVGVYARQALAIECKRLPGAASLRASKNESTVEEARWLQAYRHCGGGGGFLVYDPEIARVYAVGMPAHLAALAVGQAVPLRNRQGTALVPAWDASPAGGIEACVRSALAWMAA